MSLSKKSFLVVAAIFSLGMVNAHANLLAECNVVASQINKSVPQTIDQVTTLTSATCFPEGRAVHLQYRNKLSVPAGSVNQAKLNSIRPQLVAAWCTDPTQRATLNQVNIQYHYSDGGGKYIGKIDISKTDCR